MLTCRINNASAPLFGDVCIRADLNFDPLLNDDNHGIDQVYVFDRNIGVRRVLPKDVFCVNIVNKRIIVYQRTVEVIHILAKRLSSSSYLSHTLRTCIKLGFSRDAFSNAFLLRSYFAEYLLEDIQLALALRIVQVGVFRLVHRFVVAIDLVYLLVLVVVEHALTAKVLVTRPALNPCGVVRYLLFAVIASYA